MSSYAAGNTIAVSPVGFDCAGGATTVNVSGLGTKSMFLADGSTNLYAGACASGSMTLYTYDGAAFRQIYQFDSAHSGSQLYQGYISGSAGIAVRDVAGTAITYYLPTTNGTTGQVLSDSGAVTCDAHLPASMPSTCHLLQWVSLASTNLTDTANLVRNNAANAWSTGLQDFSAANFKGPIASGFVATSFNHFGYDSTSTNWHLWIGADSILAPFASTPTTGHCVQATVSSGHVTLSDSGSTNCGGGGSVAWGAISNPAGALSLTMAAYSSTFTHSATTGAATDMWVWTDGASNTGTGYMHKINLASGSAMKPWYAAVNGNGVAVGNTGILAKVGTGSVNADALNGTSFAGTSGHLVSFGAANIPADSGIVAANVLTAVPATPVPTPGTSITLTAPRGYAICTGTCTVSVPVPVAGYEFCVLNDDNIATAITLSALGSSAMYENSARTAYGTAGTGTLALSAAAANKVCIVGRDSTHYLTVSYNGAVTVN
jgi:hypothetical protein